MPLSEAITNSILFSVTSGLGIVLGLWTYGYNIMKNLGNKLTLLSPSRGFCIDVGSATTVILATKLSKLRYIVYLDCRN